MPTATTSSAKNKNKNIIFQNGVEVSESIVFKGWQPGYEYTKNIKLKNLNTKSVRLNYEIPKTRYFATLYPKVLNLSPGTTFNLPITFKPLESVIYNDEVHFQFHDTQHAFDVPIHGILPEYNLQLQETLDFGTCNAFETELREIELKNPTELDTTFEWDFKEPFNVIPISGEIKAKSSVRVALSVNAGKATVFNGTAVCKYGGNLNELNSFKIIKLNAVGKYPYVLIEKDSGDGQPSTESKLVFDNVPFGKSQTKFFSIINMTPVKTTYFVERAVNMPAFDVCFSCQQQAGVLHAYEKQKIPITFTPSMPLQEINDYFNIYSSGKLTKSLLTCSGNSIAPSVSIQPTCINFGQFELNQTSSRTFEIKNSSNFDVAFQFDIDVKQSSFSLSSISGVLKAGENKLIQVILKPQYPIIYYKKLALLIQNHDVLFVELFGTCHSETVKPALMSTINLKNYHKLCKKGLTINPPEQLMVMNNSTNILEELSNEESQIVSYEDYLSNELYNDDLATSSDSTKSNTITKQHVTLDSYYVDFGGCPKIADEEKLHQKSITLMNHTKGKLFVCWNADEEKTFTISPATAEIPPLKSYSFRITFKPKLQSQFFSTTLEGYALYKSLCDYTVVNQNFVLPSWCLNIRCTGHTFHSHEEHFPPRYIIDTENLIFPVSTINEPVYKTMVLTNIAESYPIVYDINSSLFNDWYVKPRKGFLKPREHQIFVFKFIPKKETHIFEKCEIKLNEMDKHLLEILLISTAEIARVELTNDGLLYFKPACKGNIVKRPYTIVNQSRVTINYEWKLSYECKNLFRPLKLTGSLKPHERQDCIWLFTPNKFDKFNTKARLLTWVGENRSKSQSYNLRLLGTCLTGTLQAQESYKDIGSIVVGSSETFEISLMNSNDCALDYELYVKQTVDENSANKYREDPCILELSEIKGSIEARSKKAISCRVRPARVISYQFTIEYKIIYPNEIEPSDSILTQRSEPESTDGAKTTQGDILCYLIANGVYPKLSVTDIKAIGSASNLSKDYLWRLFSIDTLNSSMNCEPNAEELIYSIATRQDANRRIINKPKVMLDFNFNAAPVHSPDTEIALFIENTGVVPTEWSILFPKDLQIELEYWSQSGNYDEEELEEMKIQDNKLFSITPKQGKLDPGEAIRIQLIYRHVFTGRNKLPVLLKINKGREIMINLVGVTVPSNSPYCYIPANQYSFLPVEIGRLEYPIQIYEIYNGGDIPARIEMDITQLGNLAIQNYSHNILECLSETEIIIPPGTSYPTKWRFSPIEAKTYQVDVTFRSNNNETNIVTFTCIGYDARKLNNFTVKTLDNEYIPNKQLFILPDQLASLTVDRIVFGDVPLFSRERKVLFVKNNSNEHRITFSWHVTSPEHVKYIRIQPSRGVVDVNQSKMCKLTFLAKHVPAFYNVDLICEIKNETEMDKYRKELKNWENEQKRQWEEFEIDDSELEKRLVKSGKGEPTVALDQQEKPSSQLSMHHFKTIPPILANNYLNESSISKVRRIRNEKKLWKKPAPPTPFLLHLNVIARTQYFNDYIQSTNTNDDPTKFIDGLLGGVAEMASNKSSEPTSLSASLATYQDIKRSVVTDDEIETLIFVFSDLLRSLINDKSFHFLIGKIKDEPIPYFLQYSQKKIGTYRKYVRDSVNEHIDGDYTHRDSITRKRSVTIADNGKDFKQQTNFDSNRSGKLNDLSEIIENSSKFEHKAVEETNNMIIENNEGEDFDLSQKLKISPIFGSFVETVLENTISNILVEAFNNEFNMTSRPRLIALPPKTQSLSISNGIPILSQKQPHPPLQSQVPKKTHSQLKVKSTDLNSNSSATLTQRSITNTAINGFK